MTLLTPAILTAALLTPLNDAPHTRRKLVLSGAAAISGVGSSRRAVAADAAPYRVAMSVILDPHNTRQRGEIVVEVLPEWAPLAAARFKELIELDYYKRTRFHRVLQGMLPGDLAIAQFGISTSRELNEAWLCKTCNRLPDEKRAQSNKRGTLSFAQASQSNTRQTQVFINLADNGGLPNFLDNQNFTPFARVVAGMEYLPKLQGESAVSQPKAAYYGEAYLNEVFPKLSFIEEVRLLE